MRPARLAALVLLAVFARAPAQIVYQTGFENPTFVDGDLLPQDAWIGSDFPPTANRALIQTAVANGGLRSVAIDAAVSGGNSDFWWKDVGFSVQLATAPIVQVKWDMHLVNSGVKSTQWGIDIYDGTLSRVTTMTVNEIGRLIAWDTFVQFDTGITVSRGTWHTFKINMNFAAASRKANFFLDGALVANNRPFQPGTSTILADADFYNVDGSGTDKAYFDNLRIEALADADGDGFPNIEDNCDATPPGDPVDVNGCSTIDSDGDGILNDLDQCPGTPMCATINGVGCPSDTDGDTIFNGCDNCPATQNMLQTDTDGDGLGDACDPCPNRRLGDVNGDTVVDSRDIQRFINIARGSTSTADERCAGDFNADLLLTPADVPGFSTLLLNP